MKLSTMLLGLAGCFLAASATGCVIHAHHDPSEDPGLVTVEITIDGDARASRCTVFDVDQIEVTLRDEFDDVVAVADAPCESFGLTIDDVSPGRYTADIVLLDFSSRPVSDILVVEGLDVFPRDELVIEADFPAHLIH